MKATGIVRRIDDLGRIVIPREIRKTLGIKEGDPLELYLTENGIMLEKYSMGAGISIERILQSLADEKDYYNDIFPRDDKQFLDVLAQLKDVVTYLKAHNI